MSSCWRYRIRFKKLGTVRFISHRDLMGVFARAFRRAELPLRMSQGFNPRPRFSLPAPLAVGIEGLDEVLELELAEDLRADELGRRLAREMPPGIEIVSVGQLPPGVKGRVSSVYYRVRGALPKGAVDRCRARDALPVVRRDGREVDIRPSLRRLGACEDGCEVEVDTSGRHTARPAEIAAALCPEAPGRVRCLSFVRTAVNLDGPR